MDLLKALHAMRDELAQVKGEVYSLKLRLGDALRQLEACEQETASQQGGIGHTVTSTTTYPTLSTGFSQTTDHGSSDDDTV